MVKLKFWNETNGPCKMMQQMLKMEEDIKQARYAKHLSLLGCTRPSSSTESPHSLASSTAQSQVGTAY